MSTQYLSEFEIPFFHLTNISSSENDNYSIAFNKLVRPAKTYSVFLITVPLEVLKLFSLTLRVYRSLSWRYCSQTD